MKKVTPAGYHIRTIPHPSHCNAFGVIPCWICGFEENCFMHKQPVYIEGAAYPNVHGDSVCGSYGEPKSGFPSHPYKPNPKRMFKMQTAFVFNFFLD